jgi:hypothetical protein
MSFFQKKIVTQVGSHEHPVSFQELGAEKLGFLKLIMKSIALLKCSKYYTVKFSFESKTFVHSSRAIVDL